ncbi:hypothetical protein JCM5353_003292 [Sporobolomyces roseus]
MATIEKRPLRSPPPSYPFYHWTNLLTILIGLSTLKLLSNHTQSGIETILSTPESKFKLDSWILHDAYLVRPIPFFFHGKEKYREEEFAWLAKSVVWPFVAMGLIGVWFGLRIIS